MTLAGLIMSVEFGPVAVEDPPGGHAAPVGDIQLQLPLGFLALQGVANPQRNPGQVDLFQPVAGSLQQVVVVGAAQPVALGRDGLVLDHGGAAVWYRPVVRMRHR
jgi:hypothetical protein